MKKSAVVLAAVACVATLAGCGGVASREANALKGVAANGTIRGIDVWTEIQKDFPKGTIVYQENVAANPAKKDMAIVFQDTPAPYRVGEPRPGDTHPLTFEGAARNLIDALDPAEEVLDGELTFEAVEDLAATSARVAFHAREAVQALEKRDSDLKMMASELAAVGRAAGGVSGAWTGAEVASEDDEARALVEQWMPRAKLIETNAIRLWRVAATHKRSEIGQSSVALMNSCRELEKLYPRRGRRRRTKAETGVVEAGRTNGEKKPPKGEGKGKDEPSENASDDGPAKAQTPADDERPETGSSSPKDDDGNSKPDGGTPQVGAFLLGVGGRRRFRLLRRRSSKSRTS